MGYCKSPSLFSRVSGILGLRDTAPKPNDIAGWSLICKDAYDSYAYASKSYSDVCSVASDCGLDTTDYRRGSDWSEARWDEARKAETVAKLSSNFAGTGVNSKIVILTGNPDKFKGPGVLTVHSPYEDEFSSDLKAIAKTVGTWSVLTSESQLNITAELEGKTPEGVLRSMVKDLKIMGIT